MTRQTCSSFISMYFVTTVTLEWKKNQEGTCLQGGGRREGGNHVCSLTMVMLSSPGRKSEEQAKNATDRLQSKHWITDKRKTQDMTKIREQYPI